MTSLLNDLSIELCLLCFFILVCSKGFTIINIMKSDLLGGASMVRFTAHMTLNDSGRTISSDSITGYHLLLALRTGYTIRPIPDLGTIQSFGYSSQTVKNISLDELLASDVHHSLFVDEMIESIRYKNYDTDELIRVEIQKINAVQGTRLIDKLTYLGEMINPSIININNSILLASGLAWGVKDGPLGTDRIEFRWASRPPPPFNSLVNYSHYFNLKTKAFGCLDHEVYGQDPRLLWLDKNRIIVSFTWHRSSPVRMGVATLFYNSSGFLSIESIYYDIRPASNHKDAHKNWTPFVYNASLFYIVHINPMEVVRPKTPKRIDANTAGSSERKFEPKTNMFAKSISTSPYVKLKNWDHYGHIRGGTNAIYLEGHDRYLAFFHTSSTLPHNWMKTYFFGAYTFSASEPFHLMDISPVPIVSDKLYQGEWDYLRNRKIDFCVFPMSFFVQGGIVYLSFGYNDHSGYIAQLNLTKLLDSLEPVLLDDNPAFN